MTTAELVWGRIENFVMAVCSITALALVCFEVFARYFFPSVLPDWGAEIIIYLMICAVLIGGSPLILSGGHIRADLFLRRMPSRLQWMVELFNLIVGLLYCAIVARFSLEVVAFAKRIDIRSDSSLQFPQWIFYIILPLAFGLMTVRYAIQVWRFLFGSDSARLRGPKVVGDRSGGHQNQ